MLLDNIYGIDMGTETVKIYERKKDRFITEKNRIAIRGRDEVFAVGNEAFDMTGRTPEGMRVISPMTGGRIDDLYLMEAVLYIILRTDTAFSGLKPTIYLSIPTDLTEVDRRSYYTIARQGRLKKSRVYLVEKPIADAMAIGIPIHHTNGDMIVNIGADSTEVSVLADQRVIMSRVYPVGGYQLDDGIRSAVRRVNNLAVSQRTAEDLKVELAHLTFDMKEEKRVRGIDGTSGLPAEGVVTSATIRNSVNKDLNLLIGYLAQFLQRIPPQVLENIKADGIYVTGGSSRIRGLRQFLSERLDMKVNISDYYDLSITAGLRRLIDKPELRHWAVSAK